MNVNWINFVWLSEKVCDKSEKNSQPSLSAYLIQMLWKIFVYVIINESYSDAKYSDFAYLRIFNNFFNNSHKKWTIWKKKIKSSSYDLLCTEMLNQIYFLYLNFYTILFITYCGFALKQTSIVAKDFSHDNTWWWFSWLISL